MVTWSAPWPATAGATAADASTLADSPSPLTAVTRTYYEPAARVPPEVSELRVKDGVPIAVAVAPAHWGSTGTTGLTAKPLGQGDVKLPWAGGFGGAQQTSWTGAKLALMVLSPKTTAGHWVWDPVKHADLVSPVTV